MTTQRATAYGHSRQLEALQREFQEARAASRRLGAGRVQRGADGVWRPAFASDTQRSAMPPDGTEIRLRRLGAIALDRKVDALRERRWRGARRNPAPLLWERVGGAPPRGLTGVLYRS